ncbi:formylglycine-generating enzyme family protein [Anaerocolumna xylanovorans]|uniref:Formylglycine-generating enzyme, required for sulfatase activity, contains SUMF1/FGE domain n=1 Tax=Anaerocolumna xylanovorans DSM 12503 TaxID=1121345 RepID=A0A1M7YLS7_9FIRM|nr:SUMF1/EgtB/PvdO family nonheme iron enzyme [Anaerocolumna xylanovorans]SHO53557.1 Formylglycine-generating enzyme, required for sulfatase activity, contains SUMF1/FGE domain [Anaerocolumna xylanovorans DSM 12503]
MKNKELNYVKNVIKLNNTSSIYKDLKEVFEFDENGIPKFVNGEALYLAWQAIKNISSDMEQELMEQRFYRNSEERYRESIQHHMKRIDGNKFMMGSDKNAKIKYCGEEPKHEVQLNSFLVSDIAVSSELYKQYNPKAEITECDNMPAGNLSWYDAVMFSKWVNCRLLTEAEWEYASRGDSKGDWCCEKEEDLSKYAWYSENSDGYIHEIGRLEPNTYGLFDIHGNLWEWCADSYEKDYYARSPMYSPLNNSNTFKKVCRGGSIHAFSEMCRCNFRNYESIDFYAADVGMRLAKNVE